MTSEQLTDKVGSPCPEFWDWLPRAYRDGDVGTEPRFTKYNMEVAYLAGRQVGKTSENQSQTRNCSMKSVDVEQTIQTLQDRLGQQKPQWIISTPRGNSEYYRTIYTKARQQQAEIMTQKLTLEEQEVVLAAIKDSSTTIHGGKMIDEDYDVVLDAMQRHRDRLWKMTEQNMRSEFIGLNIMDDIRLKQIEELDLAIKQRKEYTNARNNL